MTLDVAQLRHYYSALSDDELRSQHDLGAQAFATPEIWGLVDALFKERFGAGDRDGHGGPSAVPASRRVALGPWFVVERLAGRRWLVSEPLPTGYLTFMAVMAGLYTVVNVLGVIGGWSDYFGYHLYPGEARAPWLEFLNAAWSALFFTAASTRRPWAWYYLVWASLAGSIFNPLAAIVWYPLVWLYLARRRSQFGLSSWQFVM